MIVLGVLLASLLGVVAMDPAKDIVIAGQYVINEDGWENWVGSKIAFDNAFKRELENLPNLAGYNVTFQEYNSRGTARPALETALSAQSIGAKFIVGPSFSSESVVVSLISNVFGIPAISYGATSPALSNKDTYPLFFRNVPSDAGQGKALADLVLEFKQKKCIVVHTDDSYGLGITEVFREASRENGITVEGSITVPASVSDDEEGRELIRGFMTTAAELVYGDTAKRGIKVQRDVGTILYLGASKTLFRIVMEVAEEFDLIGAPDNAKFIWIAADGGTSLNLVDSVENLKDSSKKGLFGTTFATPTTDKFKNEMVNYWADVVACEYDFGDFDTLEDTCNWPLFEETPGRPISAEVNVFAPYAFDALLMGLYAINDILADKSLDARNVTGETMVAALKPIVVQGVTGVCEFDELQDRAPQYGLVNAKGGNWEVVGEYTDSVKLFDDLVFSDDSSTPPVFESDDPLAPGVIALIAIVCILAAALLLGIIFYCVSQQRKAAAQIKLAAANRDAETWSTEEETAEITRVESQTTMDDSQIVSLLSGTGSQKVFVEQTDEHTPLFGVARGKRCMVNETLTDSILLVNKGSQSRGYTITLPDSGTDFAFELSAKPGVGVLSKNERREVQLDFKLLFSTKIVRWIKVEFTGLDGAVYVPLRVEGEVSSRLDPMELELLGKPLGEGASSIVYRGRYRGTQVAAKVPRKQGDIKQSHLDSFMAEIALFEKLRNQFIVNFVGASHVPGKLCLCTELLERGTVFELIHRAKVSLVLKMKICYDASLALAYLHKNGVLYRDLKPDNLLVFSVSHNASVNCKLSDFGTAIIVTDPFQAKKHTGSVGTPVYMAPEMMSNEAYSDKVDVYSLAMVVWEMMAEKAPFGHLKRIWDLPRLVLDGVRPTIHEDWNPKIKKIIEKCWLHNSDLRPSAEEVSGMLSKLYDALRKSYEGKKKKAALEDDSGVTMREDGGDSAVPKRTVHTGQLNQLIEMGKAHEGEDFDDDDENQTGKAQDVGKKKKKKKSAK